MLGHEKVREKRNFHPKSITYKTNPGTIKTILSDDSSGTSRRWVSVIQYAVAQKCRINSTAKNSFIFLETTKMFQREKRLFRQRIGRIDIKMKIAEKPPTHESCRKPKKTFLSASEK